MKNFKKILMLTMLVSAMSGTALAIKPGNPISPGLINNPGDKVTDIKQTGQSAVAGVPMEVRVNVLGQGPQLVLVDETGTLIETLKFDHGNKLLTEGSDGENYLAQESKVEKIVIMKRTDGKPFGSNESGEGDGSSKNYTGSFYAESHHPNDADLHQMTLVKLGSTSDNDKHEIVSGLEYKSAEENIAGTETEFRTTVVSTIKARTVAKPGLYVGTGIFAGSLTLQ